MFQLVPPLLNFWILLPHAVLVEFLISKVYINLSIQFLLRIFGLPITILIDPEGREVARLRGDADWASDSAKAIIASVTGAES